MYRNCLVLCAAVAALLVPLGASARLPNGCVELPCLGSSLDESNPRPLPGTVVKYNYQAAGLKVDLVTLTLALPSAMQMVKAGTTPYLMVGGKPTWVLHHFNSNTKQKTFTFFAKVKPYAKRGTKLRVTLHEVARTGDWVQDRSFWIDAHVPLH
jgi:hypothetical protein